MRQEILHLLRWRWRVLDRTYTWLQPVLVLVAILGCPLVFFGTFKLGEVLRFVGPGFQWMILSLVMLMVQLLFLGSSLPAVVAALYLGSDLELLLAAPLRARSVFTARLLEVLAFPGGLLLILILLPALWGLGLRLGMGLVYYPLAILAVLCLPLLPLALGTLLTMSLVRYLPAWRVREMLAVAGTLLWLLFYLGQQALFTGFQERFLPLLMAMFTGGERPAFLTMDPGPLPGNWAAWSLVAAGLGRIGPACLFMGLFALLSLGAYGLCLLVAEWLYLSGWANIGVVQRRRRPVKTAGAVPYRTRWLPATFRAIVLKDWRVLRRDPQALLQLAWPLAFVLVWLFSGQFRGLPYSFFLGNTIVWWTGLGVAWFCLMAVSGLALAAISREGRSFWVLRSAPLSAWELIVSKFWANYLLCLGLGLLFSLGAAWLQRTGLVGFSYSLGLVMLMGMGITAIYLAFGAQSPNLTWDNPRQAYNQGSGCLGFIIGGVYALSIVLILAVPIGLPAWEPLLSLLRLVVVVGLTAGVTWKALLAARQGVEAIEL